MSGVSVLFRIRCSPPSWLRKSCFKYQNVIMKGVPVSVVVPSKRSKPVRSAEAALTRFGSVLRGTMRPCELHLWQLHRETVLSAPRRSSHRLAAVPRPGFAGTNSTVIFKKERHTSAKDSAIKRSACSWSIPARRRWRLPAHKREAVARLSRDKPATDLRLFIPHSPQGP